MRKERKPIKPKRGYEWLGAVWIGGISIFLTVVGVADGQFTFGAPEGTWIKADERPLMFWAGIAFPATVATAMIAFLIRGELQFREKTRTYRQHERDSQDD